MAGVEEENRRRVALILLGLGVFLILAGIGLGIHHQHLLRAHQEFQTGHTAIKISRTDQARLIQQVLFLLLVLVGILSISLYAFHRWSRRFRRSLLRKPGPPTPSEDVWAMHRLPEDALAEEGDSLEGPKPEPGG